MKNDYEKRRQRICYQKRLKSLFGENWKEHDNPEDCKDYEVGITKAVLQIDIVTGNVLNVFGSLAEAEKKLCLIPGGSAIGKVCRGEEKTAYGFKWRYA
ncbi:MAG: hypothetical protein MJZ37_01090 [Bacilli bacterium]|nr:hypothetical protein [Bacilli bacterium]